MSSTKKPRPTIGLISDSFDAPYVSKIFDSINNTAKERDANLICFDGGNLDPRRSYYRTLNKLYDFINPNVVNGIIVLGSTLFHNTNRKAVFNFYNKFGKIPIVNVGIQIDGIPSVLVDNKTGMKSLMNHLIHHHEFRKFSFVKGSEGSLDAEEQYDVFIETLKENKIEIDENLIFPGNFLPEAGINAVRAIFDGKREKPDAIIAANDHMAMGAVEELKNRGIQVPFDLAVTGFDNIENSQYTIPPITTVSQPFHEIGKTATDFLIDLFEEKNVPKTTLLPTELVIRDSCSYFCSKNSIICLPSSGTDKNKMSENLLRYLNATRSINNSSSSVFSVIERIVNAFLTSIETGDKNEFFKTMNEMIGDNTFENNGITDIHNLISGLRSVVLPLISDNRKKELGEDICHQILIIFTYKIAQKQLLIYDEVSSFQLALNSFQEEIFTTFEKKKQFKVLENSLPDLGLTICSLSLFTDERETEAKTVMAYNEKGMINISGLKRINLKNNLFPEEFLSSGNRYTFIAEILVDQGILIMGILPKEKVRLYRILREILKIAFNSSLFFHELQGQKNQLDNNIKELRITMEGYLETMALILEARDPYTAGHQRRVSDLARNIAAEMGLSKDQIECIRMARHRP